MQPPSDTPIIVTIAGGAETVVDTNFNFTVQLKLNRG